MVNKLIGVVIFMFCLSSCVGSKKLYKGLTKEESTLGYLYDTQQNFSEKVDTIKIANPVISDIRFTKSGNLTKTKASAIPLIIYTGWKNEHEYSIGENVIIEDLSNFVKESFISETNRSTTLFADSLLNSDLILEIGIDSIGARGPYRSNGYFLYLFLAYSYSASESAGPGTAYSKLSYTLKRNDETLLKGNASNQIETEPLVNNFKKTEELREFFSANLVEGISRTLKANIEEITNEVENYYLENHIDNKE